MIHLHCHTTFSVADGAATSEQYAAAMGGGALAITDHDNMSGIVHHHRACSKHGVKPIYGMEMTLEGKYHVTLLAKNQVGLRNLFALCKSPKTWSDLNARRRGLIALSGDLMGPLSTAILRRDRDELNENIGHFQDIFRGDFYLEMIDHGLRENERVNEALRRIPLPKVWTNDVHYLTPEDALTQTALICDRLHRRVDYKEMEKYIHTEAWLKPMPEDRVAHEIVEKCELQLKLGNTTLPKFDIPPNQVSEGGYLRALTSSGLESRFTGRHVPREYWERMDYELSVIDSMGFSGYFLIVQDFVAFAHRQQIPVGPARGSGAGSLVAWALKITGIDPIQHHLLFERFLNPERVSMPDFDIDFSISRREEVIRYVVKKYGEESVCQIATFSEMKPRSAWQSAARTLRIPHAEALDFSKMLPDGLRQTDSLREITDEDGYIRPEAPEEFHIAAQDLVVNPKWRDAMKLARRMEGAYRSVGRGAAGILISDGDLSQYIPTWDAQQDDCPIKTDDPVTRYLSQLDKTESEKVGLVKFDFLGLAELDVIDYATRLCKDQNHYTTPIKDLPLDDAKTFELLSTGHTTGVFQLSSQGMSQLVQNIQITDFDDIVAVVALYRPGPLGAGMHEVYARRKNGDEPVEYLHPDLEPILSTTYGVIIYQEQVMQIAQTISGFSLGGADILRRAMGKKNQAEMESQLAAFLGGGVDRGYTEEMLLELWRQIETFAGYGFNRSHAAGYGLIVYQTAWLKAHCPAELLAAQMQVRRDNFDEVAQFIAEAHRMGLQVKEWSAQGSPANFKVEGRTKILLGTSGLRSMSAETSMDIEKGAPFANFTDMLRRVRLTKTSFEGLLYSGALDCFCSSGDRYQWRHDVLAQSKNLMAFGKRESESHGQISMFNDIEVEVRRGEFGQVDVQYMLLQERHWSGRFVTGHPTDTVADRAKSVGVKPISKMARIDGDTFTSYGLVTDIQELKTKSGDLMAFVTIEDGKTSVRCCLFPDVYVPSMHTKLLDEVVVATMVASTYKDAPSPIIQTMRKF